MSQSAFVHEAEAYALLTRAGLPLSHPGAPGLYDRILRALQLDKKFRDGKNLFVLPTGIGSWSPRENVDWALVHDCVRAVLVRAAKLLTASAEHVSRNNQTGSASYC